jgi:hypothetical protein
MFPKNSQLFLLFLFNFFPDLLFCANSRRIYAYQKEIIRDERQPVAPPKNDEFVDQTTAVNVPSRKRENNYLM